MATKNIKTHIFACKLTSKITPAHITPFANLIAEHKRKLLDKEFLQKKAVASLFSDLLLRYVLSQFSVELARKAIIKRSSNGKPYLAGTGRGVHFSISHSYPWIICVVASSRVGSDIERERPLKKNIPQRFFTQNEQSLLSDNGLSSEQKKKLFFTLWTLKESFAKAQGTGIFKVLKNSEIRRIAKNKFVVVKNGKILRNYLLYSVKWEKSFYAGLCLKTKKLIFKPEMISVVKDSRVLNFTKNLTQSCCRIKK
jgi:4'-phosphopantetheinyl transferase